jgi:hypothetical protein
MPLPDRSLPLQDCLYTQGDTGHSGILGSDSCSELVGHMALLDHTGKSQDWFNSIQFNSIYFRFRNPYLAIQLPDREQYYVVTCIWGTAWLMTGSGLVARFKLDSQITTIYIKSSPTRLLLRHT